MDYLNKYCMEKIITKHVRVNDPILYIGAIDELTIDDNRNIRIHDGVTSGGFIVGSFGPITSSSQTGTLTLGQSTVLVDASAGEVILTLPLANLAPGKFYNIKKIDVNEGNFVRIQRSGSDTIDGETEQIISSQYTTMTIQSNGTNWFII